MSHSADRAPLPNRRAPRPHRSSDPALLSLVDRARGGDDEAMHQLMLRMIPRVRNGVRYLVRGERIDDLVQDVLVTVLQRLDSFRGEGRLEAWVDGITLRVVIGRSRRQRTVERREVGGAEPPAVPPELVWLRGGERYATARQLVEALDALPEAQRQAVVMHHVFGLTAPEIAEEEGVPHETVRSRLRAAMVQLRAHLRVRGAGGA